LKWFGQYLFLKLLYECVVIFFFLIFCLQHLYVKLGWRSCLWIMTAICKWRFLITFFVLSVCEWFCVFSVIWNL
jgi:hypothetical protein